MTYLLRPQRSAAVLAAVLSFAASPIRHHGPVPAQSAPRLRLIEVGSDSTSFDVLATVIVGDTEALLWDSQYMAADANRLADSIQGTGKHLKAIVLSHPDEDHISGAAIIVQRFPGTPVYMTAGALRGFAATAQARFKADKARFGARFADSLVTPVLLPSTHLTVDGVPVEVLADLTGDMITPMNSALWIPSQRTVLAGDIVFDGVHPWLGNSDPASRAAWRLSLERLEKLSPTTVVAGHKRSVTLPDDPDQIPAMLGYLNDFDALAPLATDAADLRNKLVAKYPALAVPALLSAGAATEMGRRYAATHPGGVGSTATAANTQRWTGTITGPLGNTMNATFDLSGSPSEPAMTVTASEGAQQFSVKATDIALGQEDISFRMQPGPVLACALKRREDGSFKGTCISTGNGATGEIVMRPPR